MKIFDYGAVRHDGIALIVLYSKTDIFLFVLHIFIN